MCFRSKNSASRSGNVCKQKKLFQGLFDFFKGETLVLIIFLYSSLQVQVKVSRFAVFVSVKITQV